MIDVKKLITGFLIVAAAAGGSGLILSGIGGSSTNVAPTPSVTLVNNTDTPTPSPAGATTNAFVPTQTPTITVPDSAIPTNTTLVPVDPNNLTEVVADNFLNGVISANPNGLQDDGTGNTTLTNPDTQAIAAALSSEASIKNFTTPNWDREADTQPLRITKSSAPEDIASYNAAINKILKTYFVDTNIQTALSAVNPDPTTATQAAAEVKKALSDTILLPVPGSLAAFQRSLVKTMVYEKNELQLMNSAASDPVRVALLIQSEDQNYTAAVKDLQTQMQKATALGLSIGAIAKNKNASPAAFVAGLLGIETANAQFVVFDPTAFAQMIKDFLNNIILQILKNTLVSLLQKKVLAWIQGSGAPRFITNWATTLVNSYAQRALSVLDSQMACIYPAYAPQLRLTLGAYYKPSGGNICANLFQAALGGSTLKQFYNNFKQGGFVAYGATTLPSGNPWGGLFFSAQVVGYNAQTQQKATIAKTTSAQGFHGDQVCSDGSNPNGIHTVCLDSNDVPFHPNPDGSCDAGFFPSSEPNGGLCANGQEPQVTTPGATTAFGLNTAVDSGSKLVTAANDIVGLLNALTFSLLNSLANLAISSASNAVNGGISGGVNGGTITPPPTPPPPVSPLACSPQLQVVSTTFPATLAETGGHTTDAAGNVVTYNWTSSDGQTAAGFTFSPIYFIRGTYSITLTNSFGDASIGPCSVIVQ